MNLLFWRKPKARQLSGDLKRAITSKFPAYGEFVDRLLMLSKVSFDVSGRHEMIRIFEPALVNAGHAEPVRYEDFEEDGQRGALLFEGKTWSVSDPINLTQTQHVSVQELQSPGVVSKAI